MNEEETIIFEILLYLDNNKEKQISHNHLTREAFSKIPPNRMSDIMGKMIGFGYIEGSPFWKLKQLGEEKLNKIKSSLNKESLFEFKFNKEIELLHKQIIDLDTKKKENRYWFWSGVISSFSTALLLGYILPMFQPKPPTIKIEFPKVVVVDTIIVRR